MYVFKKYFWEVLKNDYANFESRATRKQHWLFVLFWLLCCLIFILIYSIFSVYLGIVLGFADNSFFIFNFDSLYIFLLLGCSTIISFCAIVPLISISVRRLHDAGFSGWFYLLNFIPFGVLIFLILLLLPSDPNKNKYDDEFIESLYTTNTEKINRLFFLKERGVITEEEFQKKKDDLLK